MSKGLSDLQATIQSYGNSGDAINQFINNTNAQFYDDWKTKVDAAKDKLDSARKIGEDIGEGYLGMKATHYAVKQFVNKYYNKKNQSDGDEDGKGDGDESNEPVDEGESGGGDQGGEPQGGEPDPDGGDEADVLPEGMSESADVGGESGFELQDMNTTNQPLQTGDDGGAAESSFGDQGVSDVPSTQGTATLGQAQELPADADVFQPTAGQSVSSEFVARPPPAQSVSTQGNVQQQILDQDPEAGVGGATEASEGAAEGAGDLVSGATEAASGAADAITGAVSAGTEAATAATTAATEAASGVGSAVLGGLGVAAEALGPLGLLAGVGIGLYELFHHPKPKPPPPPITTASTKGEMVLPSFDSVIDTPASVSAF